MQFDIFAPPASREGAAPRPFAPPGPPGESLGPPPVRRLLDAAAEALAAGQAPFRTAAESASWSEHVLGSPYAPEGRWTLDDVYDALEGAAHRHLAAELAHLAAQDRISALRERESEWFHGRALTESSREQAQFSTPLPIAEGVAAIVAAARGIRMVLEPCAGTGSLARPLLGTAGIHLQVNETDPRRREVLGWLGLRPSGRDALRLPMDPARFDAVLSNPPFGAMSRGRAGRGATEFAATNIGQRFAAAHLRSLRPHGLLVRCSPPARSPTQARTSAAGSPSATPRSCTSNARRDPTAAAARSGMRS